MDDLERLARRLEGNLSRLLGRRIVIPVAEAYARRCGCRGHALYVRGLTREDVEVLTDVLAEELKGLGEGEPAAELDRDLVRALRVGRWCERHRPGRHPALMPLR